MVALALAALLGSLGPECFALDARGERYPVCFDPGTRLELEADPALPSLGAGARGVRAHLAFHLRMDRHSRHAEQLSWRRDHAFADAELEVAGGHARLDATAWRAEIVRRLDAPFVLVPTERPIRIPFPFDVGVSVAAAEVRTDLAEAPGLRTVALDVLRAALLLDAARDVPGVRRLAFGPELAYGIAFAPGGPPRHGLVPFTGGVVELRAESADGLWAAWARGRAGFAAALPGGFARAWRAEAQVERVALAIDDQPVALVARGEAERGPGPARAAAFVGLALFLGPGT